MTRDEGIAVLKILCEADGGCSSCAESLFELFAKRFPGVVSASDARAVFVEKFWANEDDAFDEMFTV